MQDLPTGISAVMRRILVLKIPNTEDKYFYVWLDAPVGYMASFKNLCQQKGMDFDEYWSKDNHHNTEIYHFIGKDIVYFHALFYQPC